VDGTYGPANMDAHATLDALALVPHAPTTEVDDQGAGVEVAGLVTAVR
jgi:hypothetical protein